jgi:hypothetical protein
MLACSSRFPVSARVTTIRELAVQPGKISSLVLELFPKLTVANGPFSGMKYPVAESVCSELIPKLLGSYESELREVVKDILAKDYTEIVDIGCAEGYYAVGLGIRFPKATIYAFDTDANARALCLEMARLNGVDERLKLGEFCDESKMLSLALGRKALIISDCEGYEKVLFTTKVVSFLAKHDVLIETHDCRDIEISDLMRERFSITHNILAIDSIDDIKKVKTYHYPELMPYDAATRLIALAERRPGIMQWLYMSPKSAASNG